MSRIGLIDPITAARDESVLRIVAQVFNNQRGSIAPWSDRALCEHGRCSQAGAATATASAPV